MWSVFVHPRIRTTSPDRQLISVGIVENCEAADNFRAEVLVDCLDGGTCANDDHRRPGRRRYAVAYLRDLR